MTAGFGLHVEEYKNMKNSQKLYWKIIFCLERTVRGKCFVVVITQFLWGLRRARQAISKQ